jgi:hypothetical protein
MATWSGYAADPVGTTDLAVSPDRRSIAIDGTRHALILIGPVQLLLEASKLARRC